MAGVCTGPGPCDTHPTGHGGDNFVTRGGGFDPYLRAIINALKRKGHSESQAVQLAIGTVQRWARGEGNVTPETRARAAASLAHWEALKASAHSLTASPSKHIHDLADAVVATTDGPTLTYPAETALIRARAKTATFPHQFQPAKWTHPNGHPRCKNCGQEERTGGVCTKPAEKPTAGPATSISMAAFLAAATVDLGAELASGLLDMAWSEQMHPRGGKGTAAGGKFVAKNAAPGAASTPAGMTGNVRDFQRRMGLPVTGVIDAKTAAAITREAAAKAGGGKGKGKGKHAAKHKAKKPRKITAKVAAARARSTQRNVIGQHIATINSMTVAQRTEARRRMPVPPTGYVWGKDNTLRAVKMTRAQQAAPLTGI